jgi:hypothetical protein
MATIHNFLKLFRVSVAMVWGPPTKGSAEGPPTKGNADQQSNREAQWTQACGAYGGHTPRG